MEIVENNTKKTDDVKTAVASNINSYTKAPKDSTVPLIKYLKKTPISHVGHNMSMIQSKEKKTYVGTIRESRLIKNNNQQYPECENITHLVELDTTFSIISSSPLVESKTNKREKFVSYTTGLEDCRLIDDHSLLAVTLDTNPHWRAEISYVTFDPLTKIIQRIQPLSIDKLPKTTEKNWLVLRQWENECHLLHWFHPLRIVRVNLNTGNGEILKESFKHTIGGSSIHGGCCLYLQTKNQFLINIRVYNDQKKYAYTKWLLLDHQYDIIKQSPPFRFQDDGYYEMCMSLILTKKENEEILIANVSVEDFQLFVYTFSMSDILDSLISVSL